MKVVGLTGGIGCGKSAVAAMFRELGAATIDADQVAREVVEPGTPGYAEAVARFGPAAVGPDGALNRGALGELVFRDPAARRDLEAIVHPRVYLAIGEHIAEEMQRGTKLAIVEIPLLFETQAPLAFAATICVTASLATQKARVKNRSGYADDVVAGILAAQMDPVKKAAMATYVVDNDGDLDATRRQVEELHRKLTDMQILTGI